MQRSAALLAYRSAGGLQVFLAHMGGPFWARKDAGAWSIPKGLYETEEPLAAARREFAEEIGVPAPAGPEFDLGEFRQPSGKVIRAFAVPAGELAFVASNTFEMEWPRGSGVVRQFPEVDRAQWFHLPEARLRIVPGQVSILEALERALGD